MATPGIGASGVVGVAVESTPGTYEEPTKFFPIMNESFEWTQNTNFRSVIRGSADPLGAVAGDGNVEGDLQIELLEDVLVYMLQAARGTLEQTGSEAPYTYEFTPSHAAVPEKTLSITIMRNEQVFGYTGCVVGSMAFGVDNGQANLTASMIGLNEEEQDTIVPTYDDVAGPFGAGSYNLQIPTTQQIFDADNFNLTVDDSAEAQFRLQNKLGAAFVKFGERSLTLSVDRDFLDRVEYDHYKELTSQSISVEMERLSGDGGKVAIHVPVAIIESYSAPLSSVGDLVRGSTSYRGVLDESTGGSYRIEVETDEDLELGNGGGGGGGG